MKTFALGKAHKLCSKTAIDALFAVRPGTAGGAFSALAYPLRAVWKRVDERPGREPLQFLISVPKKKLHHAVDRVQMRRRIREAYRLNRPMGEEAPTAPEEAAGYDNAEQTDDAERSVAAKKPVYLDVAFIYVADHLEDYRNVERAMRRLLAKMPH